jgi:hypothetical protein
MITADLILVDETATILDVCENGFPQQVMSVLHPKADMCSANRHVRFTPNSDRESGLALTVMSALPPKADMCSAK